jgi:hypothetical protein
MSLTQLHRRRHVAKAVRVGRFHRKPSMMTHHKTKGKPWSLSPLPLHPPVGAKREQEQGSRRPKQSSWEDAAASAPVGLLSATHGKGR